MAAASAGYGYPHVPCPLLQCVVCDLCVVRETHGADVTELVRVHRLLESDEGQVVVQVAWQQPSRGVNKIPREL